MKHMFGYMLIVILILSVQPANGQDRWVIGAGSAYQIPIGGLQDRFLSAFSTQVSAGRSANEYWYWEVRGEYLVFDRENVERISRDTLVLADSISMDLELYGLGIEGRYHFFGRQGKGIINPYLGLSAGMYRWFAERAAYNHEGISVPEFKQRDWSAGLGLGFGNEFLFLSFLSLSLDIRYHIVIGELWPTLSLGMESVGGFQTIAASTRLRIYF